MPAVRLAAEILDAEGFEWQTREYDHAVIALLSVQRDVLIAKPLKALERKLIIGAFGFLQAEHVRAGGLDEARHQIDAKAHRIDIPGRDRKLHRFAGCARQDAARGKEASSCCCWC